MKTLALIPVLIVSVMTAVAAAVWAAAHFTSVVHFAPVDWVVAMLIAVISGITSIVPLVRNAKDNLAGAIQRAMVGTVLHLIIQVILAGTAIALHVVHISESSLLWLLAGYWVSLVVLLTQLRHIIFQTINTMKLQKQ